MRKEVLFAIFAGTLFGLAIAFGVWRANNAFNSDDLTDEQTENKIQQASAPAQQFDLTIASPDNMDVVSDGTATVKGLTRPDTLVVISGETQDYMTKSDTGGQFEQEVILQGGMNEVLVTAFTADEKISEEKVTLVYSSEFDKKSATDSAALAL